MSSIDSRDTKGRGAGRRYEGEDEASSLLNVLNGKEKSNGAEKLRGLMKALREVETSSPSTKERITKGDPGLREQKRRFDAVNAFLKGLDVTPYVRPPSTVGGSIRLEWRTTPEYAKRNGVTRGKADADLYGALAVIELTKKHRITALRECKSCRRWFYARFKHSKFCPDRTCKDDFNRNDPDEKTRRREWQEELLDPPSRER